MDLLDDTALERSTVVANRTMNRERGLAGSNGYARELGIDVAEFLAARLAGRAGPTRWLDLCCGAGVAVLECAGRLTDPRLRITGVDLVDFFAGPAPAPRVLLVTASVPSWSPPEPVDLITCVHGLHYVGDKLALLTAAASWLTADGLLAASFDATGIRSAAGEPLGRRLTTALRMAGFDHDARRRRIRYTGGGRPSLPLRYLGADDHAGPNYTGQPAVNSYYA